MNAVAPSPLDTRLPPPLLMLALAALAWWLDTPTVALRIPGTVAVAVAVVGLALNLAPKRLFRRAGTTVNPLRPHASTRLITTGPYRHTRNPMYLGHALMLLGWALYLGNAVAMLAVPLYMSYITRYQIMPEERQLAARFPHYTAYCRAVPRWF